MANNRGVVYVGSGKVEVRSIDFPKLIDPRGKRCDHGVILKVVSTNICGSDQHMVRGRTTAPEGLVPAIVLNDLMDLTRAAGAIGIPGLYVTEDPGAKDTAARGGSLSLRLGLGWAKSHAFFTGQTPVMKYNRALMMAVLHDRIKIAKAVNATLISLDDAPSGYADFDRGVARKFVIDPHGLLRKRA